jgi:hypothetical protein
MLRVPTQLNGHSYSCVLHSSYRWQKHVCDISRLMTQNLLENHKNGFNSIKRWQSAKYLGLVVTTRKYLM